MWDFYAPEPRMPLNLGNDRRRIEVANSLLFTIVGSPVLYYGDEIGMVDNIWLEDRDGVRTPMQWDDTVKAGVSTANPSALDNPVIDDESFGYRHVNVAEQRANPGSLLSRMREMMAVRKTAPAFGRGELRLLAPAGVAVLAYLRVYGDEAILVANNLSDEAQAAELDLAAYAGRTPVDMFTDQVLAPVTGATYLLELPRYGYCWLRLR